MQVRVKTPRIRVEIEGESIPQDVLEAVKKSFPDEVEILEGDDEYVDIFKTDWYKEISSEITPGDVLKIYRENRRWTQAELGEKLGGVAKQNIYLMEVGKRRIGPGMAIKLSRVFDVPIERFLERESGA